MSDDPELDDLIWHWGEAYVIAHMGPDMWLAQRRDNRKMLRAGEPEELRGLITEDYEAQPVSREVEAAAPPDGD